jgi:hypothetical protein
MSYEWFFKLITDRFEHCRRLMLGDKDKEYSRGDDKLYNFKRSAEVMRCSPEKALWGMVMKHLVSMQDIVEDVEREGRLKTTRYKISEKITDIINYMVLLEALLEERDLNTKAGQVA